MKNKEVESICYGRDDILNISYLLANETMSHIFGKMFTEIDNLDENKTLDEIHTYLVENLCEEMAKSSVTVINRCIEYFNLKDYEDN